MTKEMAINILRGAVLGADEQTHEAVFMAIKALKEQAQGEMRKNDTPTADAEFVRHGHWTNISISVTGNSSAECSLCGTVVHNTFTYVNRINYCPNCGAKMDAERREDAE